MKKVELLFNVKVEGSEMKVTSFVQTLGDVDLSTRCSVIDKETQLDGSFNIILTGIYGELPNNRYEQVMLDALYYCKEMWICDAFIATALRHIIEKMYAAKYLSVDEYSDVWTALIDLCTTTGVNLLPYKIYGIQSNQDNNILARFIYVPASRLHIPVCKDERIIAYLEYDKDNNIIVRVSDENEVKENLIDKVKDVVLSN